LLEWVGRQRFHYEGTAISKITEFFRSGDDKETFAPIIRGMARPYSTCQHLTRLHPGAPAAGEALGGKVDNACDASDAQSTPLKPVLWLLGAEGTTVRATRCEARNDLQYRLPTVPQYHPADMTGPYEVFTKLPDAKVHLVWKSREPVTADGGMQIVPTTTFADCPQLDLICVPGGAGINPLLNDPETLKFVRRQAKGARFVTSVCSGALVLGAAGLLAGKRATTHWMSREMLPALGALSVAERVVVDGNVITGGGVTAGIDFALTVAAEAFGEDIAKSIQLGMEYDPHPPFDAGSPDRAGPDLVAKARSGAARRQAERQSAVDAAAAALRQAR
jgi:cyclohexyl-isocyanide hydratase